MVPKPVDLNVLLAVIRRFCAGSGDAEQGE
jgi:hypothetical protein